MSACEELRTAISRVVDAEADPAEALAVGRHLADCTVCRIVLAREYRLASAIDSLADPIDVDESFLKGVMDTLPNNVPRRSRARRGLRLAGFGLGAATIAAWLHALSPSPGSLSWALRGAAPVLDSATSPALLDLAPRSAAGVALAASGMLRLVGLAAPDARWAVAAVATSMAVILFGSLAGIAAVLVLRCSAPRRL